MRIIRQIHAYMGLMIAPSVLFFAFTGGLQLFNLHEAHGGYRPPAIFQSLGDIHKDQVTWEEDQHHGPPSTASGGAKDAGPTGPDDHDEPTMKVSTLALKWFYEAVAVGLFTSTVLGLWIGLRFTRTPRLSWGLLIAGLVIPVALLFL